MPSDKEIEAIVLERDRVMKEKGITSVYHEPTNDNFALTEETKRKLAKKRVNSKEPDFEI